ncbi:MAG: hypothetical protein GY716_15885 [bacterium]|nr:hypothetical protein [bacterium]
MSTNKSQNNARQSALIAKGLSCRIRQQLAKPSRLTLAKAPKRARTTTADLDAIMGR